MSQLGVTKIELGQYVQDDVGTQWHVVQETRHYKEPDVIRLVLKEYTLREPRMAICRNNGTEFACKNSQATCILSIMRLSGIVTEGPAMLVEVDQIIDSVNGV